MKFLHLSDFHLGKRVNDFSMLDDQKYILGQIIDIADKENPDGVFIVGDIYDKPLPPAEAVELFDDFLFQLSERKLKVFIISGNHDSPERIAFGARLMNRSGIYISEVYNGNVSPIPVSDKYGTAYIYMLPFIKPAHVKRFYPDSDTESYTYAIRTAISAMKIDTSFRNVILTHQFVTGASRCESEDISVGGSDNVDASVFELFDYVALGHIHSPQSVSKDTVRYCGTPLKYSFSESKHKKSVTIVELFEKGNTKISTIPLIPLRDMKEIRGSYAELSSKSFYCNINTNDYIHIILTDENDIPDAVRKLGAIYPNIMKLDYDNARTRYNLGIIATESVEKKTPSELFSEFYELQNNDSMNEKQKKIVSELIESIWEGRE